MSVQTERRPGTETSRQRSVARQSHVWWLAVLLAMAIAAIVGVAVTAHLTGPATTTDTVYHEPNANAREGRVPSPVEPNANAREGRVPSPVEPNANGREGRVPTPTSVEPNANTREGRVPSPAPVEPNANAREGRVSGNG